MRVPLSQSLWLAPVTQPFAPWGAADKSSIGRERNGCEDILEGTYFTYRSLDINLPVHIVKAFVHHSALACGKSLWSNKWHWFCRAGVFVAVCILILSIFDMSGRGWAVMWKMTPLCQRAKAKTQQGTLPLKQCPLPSHITVYYFLTVVSLCNWHLQKRMQRLRLPFFSPPFVAQAQNTQTQTHTHTHIMSHLSVWV